MSIEQKHQDLVLPSDPSQKKELKIMLTEACNTLQKIDDQKEALKGVIETISEKFNLPKPLLNKLVKTMHKHNFDQQQSEHDNFEFAYEAIIGVDE